MSTKSSGSGQPKKGTEGNLGQKKAAREEAADEDFQHMGASKKAKSSKQKNTR